MNEYSGKLYTTQEVADILDPTQASIMDPRTVTKELSRNGIQSVSGWPASAIDALAEYRALPRQLKIRCGFVEWRQMGKEEQQSLQRLYT